MCLMVRPHPAATQKYLSLITKENEKGSISRILVMLTTGKEAKFRAYR